MVDTGHNQFATELHIKCPPALESTTDKLILFIIIGNDFKLVKKKIKNTKILIKKLF